MILYCVEPPGGEATGEGEDNSEWFTRLEDAKRRFREWRDELREAATYWRWDDVDETYVHPRTGERTTHPVSSRYRTYRVTLVRIRFANQPTKRLVLNILNRKGYVAERTVIAEYDASDDQTVQELNAR